MNIRMFLHVCVYMCVLCTHHYIHDMVYNIFWFIDNIHVYAQYMYMIQYTATSVLHMGPVTAYSFAHGVFMYMPCTHITTMDSTHVCTHPIQE